MKKMFCLMKYVLLVASVAITHCMQIRVDNNTKFTKALYKYEIYENSTEFFNIDEIKIETSVSPMNGLRFDLKPTVVNDQVLVYFNADTNQLNVKDRQLVTRQPKDKFSYEIYALNRTNNMVVDHAQLEILVLSQIDTTPKFLSRVYDVDLAATAPIGTAIVVLQTFNKPNGQKQNLQFSIDTGNDGNLFSIPKQTSSRAILSLAKLLDKSKTTALYKLYVKVLDLITHRFSFCEVNIRVMLAANDVPRFTKDLYQFRIVENAPVGTMVGQISAGEDRRTIKYRIDNEPMLREHRLATASDFRLDDSTGILYVNSPLNREKYEHLTVYVSAIGTDSTNEPYIDHSVVKIEIQDVNDNAPRFTKAQYYASVNEDAKVGSYVLRVEAKDHDTDKNSQVRYKLVNSPQFSIDPISGTVRLASLLDHEQVDSYNVTIVAYDLGTQSLNSTVHLIVKIVDVNDNAPYFISTNGILSFNLTENQPIGTHIGNITAHDTDKGSNGDLSFKLLNGTDFFEIQSSGLYNTMTLVSKFVANYENLTLENPYTFILRAYSGPLFTDTTVKVFVEDLNDHAPTLADPFKIVFNNYDNYFLTESNLPRVPAHDIDINDTLTFGLVDKIGNQFISLDRTTGEIRLKPILNANNHINVSFIVSVTDGIHEVHARCNLIVVMVSDKMLADSVTISFANINTNEFLVSVHDKLIENVLSMIKISDNDMVHVYSLQAHENGVNASLAVSRDYSKDLFVPSWIIKQIFYAGLSDFKRTISLETIDLYENDACALEPCLNYQLCRPVTQFASVDNSYQYSKYIQFRSVNIKNTFVCDCPMGFTGLVTSSKCDLEINLCYSNPCGNNGLCVSLESGYACICDPDYTGPQCQFALNSTICNKLSYDDQQTMSFGILADNSKVDSDLCKTSTSACHWSNTSRQMTCTNCTADPRLAMHYNRFCELRTRSFPVGQNSFFIIPGLQDRLRFKIKLTFSTVKPDSYLIHNGRLDRHGYDFVELKIDNYQMVFRFSLGNDQQPFELCIKHLDVADGKWRTVTVEYNQLNVKLSVDNDDLPYTDSCESARSQMKNTCFRVEKTFNLPPKCLNQIENCFRFLDLNGPMLIGRGPFQRQQHISKSVDKSMFQGCLGDLFVNERFVDLNTHNIINFGTEIGCTTTTTSTSSAKQFCNKSICDDNAQSPCFNNAQCQMISQKTTASDKCNGTNDDQQQFACICPTGFKGKYCQFKSSEMLRMLITPNEETNGTNDDGGGGQRLSQSTCPAKWWGNPETGICGPCQCDETLNFSPDCNKTTGQCMCRAKYYRRTNRLTNKDHCVPCDCNVDGSLSLQCQPLSGQCTCLNGSGITGRKCDACLSPFAEIVEGECRVLNKNQCPKVYYSNTWWPRTHFNEYATTTCPKGSYGQALRFCDQLTSWSSSVNLSNCSSTRLVDMQLVKWDFELSTNRSQLNEYQTLKLIDDLNQLTEDAEFDDEYDDNGVQHNDLSTEQAQPSSATYLYSHDLAVIKNLTVSIVQYELANAPSFLHIKDKYFLKNLFTLLNRILSSKYDAKWKTLKTERAAYLTDLLVTLDKYLNCLLHYNQLSIIQQFQYNYENIKFLFDTQTKRTQQYRSSFVQFHLTGEPIDDRLSVSSVNANKISYITVRSIPNGLPNDLVLNDDETRTISAYQVASDILMINTKRSRALQSNRNHDLVPIKSPGHMQTTSSNNSTIVAEFLVNLNSHNDKLKPLVKMLYCVFYNGHMQKWSTLGARILFVDLDRNVVRCAFDHFSIYSVMLPLNQSVYTEPAIAFTIVTYTLVPVSVACLLFVAFMLALLGRCGNTLTICYSNLYLNMGLMQILFLTGVNSSSYQVLCKLISVFLHYLHVSSFLWLMVIAFHLYRMLTELRDINKSGSKPPAFYFVIAYVVPSIIASLTLGIKQDLYTVWSSSTVFNYCWFNLGNIYDIVYALVIPTMLTVTIFFVVCLLSYRELKRKTFKQTDVELVRFSLVANLLILPVQSLVLLGTFLVVFMLHKENFFYYEIAFLVASVVYSILIVLLTFVFNKTFNGHFQKIFHTIKDNVGDYENKSDLNVSKSKLCKTPYVCVVDDKKPSKMKHATDEFYIDYNENTNPSSISTTTTSGTTFDNLENIKDLVNDMRHKQVQFDFEPVNYTTTFTEDNDTRTDDSDLNYKIDFGLSAPHQTPFNRVNICDVVNVGEIIKNRMTGGNTRNINNNQESMVANDLSTSFLPTTDYGDTTKTFSANCTPSKMSVHRQDDDKPMATDNISDGNLNVVDVGQVLKNKLLYNEHVSTTRKLSQLGLFWPCTLADYDLNTTNKTSHSNDCVMPDILSCSTARMNTLTPSTSNSSSFTCKTSNNMNNMRPNQSAFPTTTNNVIMTEIE